MDTIRTFIAVSVSAEVKQHAAELIQRLRASRADVKWVDPQNMHLTLKFLGDVLAAKTPEICQAVAEVAGGFAPLQVSFRGAGAFPNAQQPRTVWLGIHGGAPELTELAATIEEVLVDLGYPKEDRAFHPHLTLGRLRNPSPALRDLTRFLGENAEFDAEATQVQEVTVFASHLGHSGPTYEPLGRARLGESGGPAAP
jgi:RNA 2',3'-cyclic 3'-phosphodiesterase